MRRDRYKWKLKPIRPLRSHGESDIFRLKRKIEIEMYVLYSQRSKDDVTCAARAIQVETEGQTTAQFP